MNSNLSCETPHRETAVAIVAVGRVEVTGVEVEVVRAGRTRVGSRGPIVTVEACEVQPTGAHAPGRNEVQWCQAYYDHIRLSAVISTLAIGTH